MTPRQRRERIEDIIRYAHALKNWKDDLRGINDELLCLITASNTLLRQLAVDEGMEEVHKRG